MGPDVENERTTKPDSAASVLTAGLGARPINCDQVAWMLNAIERYLPPTPHPRVSRAREMQKYALLYELMEVAHLYFEDANAQHNGTPHDVKRFQYASKQAEAAAHQGMNIAGNGAQALGQLMREQARSEIRGGPVPFA